MAELKQIWIDPAAPEPRYFREFYEPLKEHLVEYVPRSTTSDYRRGVEDSMRLAAMHGAERAHIIVAAIRELLPAPPVDAVVVTQTLPNPRHGYCGGNNTEFVRNASGKWMVFRCLDCPSPRNEFEIDGE